MSTKERVQEYGFMTGRDAQYMKSIGATDAQICNWVNWSNQQTPAEYKETFKAAARKGYTAKHAEFAHPIYNAYKARMADCVNQNWACVRS
jgi:hypothetical protein